MLPVDAEMRAAVMPDFCAFAGGRDVPLDSETRTAVLRNMPGLLSEAVRHRIRELARAAVELRARLFVSAGLAVTIDPLVLLRLDTVVARGTRRMSMMTARRPAILRVWM